MPVVAVPLQVAFPAALFGHPLWVALDLCVDAVFVGEILVNLRTGYHQAGMYIATTRAVAAHYLQGDLLNLLLAQY